VDDLLVHRDADAGGVPQVALERRDGPELDGPGLGEPVELGGAHPGDGGGGHRVEHGADDPSRVPHAREVVGGLQIH
jgi:hypothetical protein